MKTKIVFVLIISLIAPMLAFAKPLPSTCAGMYLRAAESKARAGRFVSFGGEAVADMAAFGWVFDRYRFLPAMATMVAGKLAKGVGTKALRQSYFYGLVGHALDEARERTVGPYTFTLAKYLNDGLNDLDHCGNEKHASFLTQKQKLRLSAALGATIISPDELLEVMGRLRAQESLCDASFEPISPRDWAEKVIEVLAGNGENKTLFR